MAPGIAPPGTEASPYAEGTRFELAEAESIVFDGQSPATRPADSHDITGTFRVVADRDAMRRVPGSPRELADLLRERHRAALGHRSELSPGTFTQDKNRAGDTELVLPEEVEGTLAEGYALYRDLAPGLPRAIFIMFLVTDVHPFRDGNGRVARIMMNAELTAADAVTIIVPTVFRTDYVSALRALSLRERPTPLVDAFLRLHRASALDFTDLPRVRDEIARRNGLREPDAARLLDAAP